MLITEVPGGGTERTWRPPMSARIALAFCLGALMAALPGLWLALTLATNQVPEGVWIALALAVVVWAWLAWRVLAQSVTLTPDTLVIRNTLATERVPLDGITAVGFRRGRLTVTSRGAAAWGQFTVSAGNLGPSRWTGLRGNADAIAESIAYACGLPPLPPRREIISRNWAWIMLLAAALCVGVGVYCAPLWSWNAGSHSALRLVGGMLYPIGAPVLGFALRMTLDHRRKRSRRA